MSQPKDSRAAILAAIRANKPALEAPAPIVPSFDNGVAANRPDRVAAFVEALENMGGKWLAPAPGASVTDTVRELLADAAIVCSNVPEIDGNRTLYADSAPADLADVDTAVLRARFAVAETGSVCFTEAELVVNAIAYLAQHLLVLLDPKDIVTNMHRAYQRRDHAQARYSVFHTGPSATADIQGVLVRGAQGVRSLTVIPAGARAG